VGDKRLKTAALDFELFLDRQDIFKSVSDVFHLPSDFMSG
jgi:hypothetical protein